MFHKSWFRKYYVQYYVLNCRLHANLIGIDCSGTMPEDSSKFYGFTRLAIELNELSPSLRDKLPITDTRSVLLSYLSVGNQFALSLLLWNCFYLSCIKIKSILIGRFRPDQRLLEEGNLAGAESLKMAVEQKQRDRRKKREEENDPFQPLWFRLVIFVPWDVNWQSEIKIRDATHVYFLLSS